MGYEPVTIREAAQLEVLLFVGLAFVGSLLIIYWGFQTYQFGRIIRDTPPEPVEAVAMGRTEIQGEIVPHERVFDQPFTEGQCVYCEYTVEEYREDSDDDEKHWETIDSGSFETPFDIDDGTGRILVDPTDETIYEISEQYHTEISVDSGERPPDPVGEFLTGPTATDGADSSSGGEGGIRGAIQNVKVRFFGHEVVDSTDDSTEDVGVTDDRSREPGTTSTTKERDRAAGEGTQEPAADEGEPFEHVRRYEIASASPTNRKRRYKQEVLPVEEETYVYGGTEARDTETRRSGEVTEVIRTDPSTGEFIVSDRDEFALASGYRNRSVLYIVAGILTSVMILALLAQILVTGPVYGIEAAMP